MGVCEEHKKRKKGVCNNCSGCRCCFPPAHCTTKTFHVNYKRIAKKLNLLDPSEQIIKKRKINPERALKINKPNDAYNEDSSDNDDETPKKSKSPKNKEPKLPNNKSILMNAFDCLGLDFKGWSEVSKKGVSGNSDRSNSRAHKLVKDMLNKICDLVRPGDEQFRSIYLDKLDKHKALNSDYESIKENAIKLLNGGNRTTRVVIQSLLAKSYFRDSLISLLENKLEKKSLEQFGAKKFTYRRKLFDMLSNGMDVPSTNNYTFRVSSDKIKTCIDYIMNTLNIKPGAARKVKVADHVFENMPVYEKGEISIEKLFDFYRATLPEDHIGLQTFSDIIKLMTNSKLPVVFFEKKSINEICMAFSECWAAKNNTNLRQEENTLSNTNLRQEENTLREE